MFLGESSDVVEIQLHGVWLAGVRGADVAYWACKKCKTKVDQETGCCKKQSTHGCATEQEDSRTILATVHLADWTGQLDNLLVNEAALCELTGFKTAKLLLTEVDRHGTAALCFRHRCDVRVATSHKHKQWSGSAASQSTASTQLSLSASQASPAEVRTPQECQFEVVHAKPALIADFDESHRPCVPKILRLEACVLNFDVLTSLHVTDSCALGRQRILFFLSPVDRATAQAAASCGCRTWTWTWNTRHLEWFLQKPMRCASV